MASKEYHNALEMLNKKDKYNYIRAFEMLNDKEKEYVIKAMNGKEGKYDKPKYKLIFVEKIGDSFKYEGKKYKLHPTYNNLMFSADGDVLVVSEPEKVYRDNYQMFARKPKISLDRNRRKCFSYLGHARGLALYMYNTFNDEAAMLVGFKDGDRLNCSLENIIKIR